MSAVEATYYDGLTSKARPAFVSVREPQTLEVEILPDGTNEGSKILWPLEHGGMEWERTATTLRLTFGEHPRRVVLVRDPLFIKSFAIRMRYAGRQGVYDRMLATARRGPILFFFAVIALLGAGYMWVLPFAAEHLAMALPVSLDRRLGDTMYETMGPTLSIDSARSAALQRFGDRLVLAPSHQLRFHVAEEDQVNAFAMPGGHIVVYTGLLDKIEKPEQLVALLAHEASHVEKRHTTRAVVRDLSGTVFIALLVGDAGGVAAAAAKQGEALRGLGYSRSLESEADEIGIERMRENHIDPHGMVELLHLFEEEGDVPEAMAFLSTHPLTKERLERAEKAAAAEPMGVTDPGLQKAFEQLRK
ncbi:MAG TPA: M48 family metallopeptidase [Flavobacteriales bacterium]|nr:M48 family metallopeptidase [Flavobacteriales bacterium]